MKYIDKATFNKLGIKEQVKLFNSLLREHNSIKEVCDYIGISYSTIRDRFSRYKYIFNKHSKSYELNYNKNRNIEIEKIVEDIMSNINRKRLDIHELNKDDIGEITVRSFRIYENILNDFIDFCQNCSLKQYDVLSLFILEGMNRYKKI
ncbi:MAG: hypothetical protein MSA15_09680 [Clostridium sp.]|nr:hypothetical protein [Clostridium sp.]